MAVFTLPLYFEESFKIDLRTFSPPFLRFLYGQPFLNFTTMTFFSRVTINASFSRNCYEALFSRSDDCSALPLFTFSPLPRSSRQRSKASAPFSQPKGEPRFSFSSAIAVSDPLSFLSVMIWPAKDSQRFPPSRVKQLPIASKSDLPPSLRLYSQPSPFFFLFFSPGFFIFTSWTTTPFSFSQRKRARRNCREQPSLPFFFAI